MCHDFYSQEGAAQRQDVNDLHRQLWWRAVGEAPHMHIHREQGPHSASHTPTAAAKGRIHLSGTPVVISSTGCSKAEKVPLTTSRRAIRGQPEAHPRAHFEIFTFGFTSISQDPLNQGSSVQSTQDATGLFNDSSASKPSRHIQYFSARQTDWGCFCTSLKELNKSKLNTSIVLIILFYTKTIKCAPLAFYFLLVLLNVH